MEMAGPEPEVKSSDPSSNRPFDDFSRLGAQIYLHTPEDSKNHNAGRSNSKSPPDLIVICSWLGAQSRYISKYTKEYVKRFPGVPILLIRQDGSDMMWRPKSWQIEYTKPAVAVIDNYVKQTAGKPKVLMHLFSNGGAYSACQLAEIYHQHTSSETKLLPISALVLDSLPSFPNVWRSHSALSEMLPKSFPLNLLSEVALWTLIGTTRLANTLGLYENPILAVRRKLNERQGPFMQPGLKRMYIYSQADKLVPWEDVEAHAREATEIVGKDKVLLEDFNTSEHVAHVRVDSQRYWGLIEQFWNDNSGA